MQHFFLCPKLNKASFLILNLFIQYMHFYFLHSTSYMRVFFINILLPAIQVAESIMFLVKTRQVIAVCEILYKCPAFLKAFFLTSVVISIDRRSIYESNRKLMLNNVVIVWSHRRWDASPFVI